MNYLTHIFKDKNGQIIIFQPPNLPLIGWVVCKVISALVDNPTLDSGLGQLGSAFLILWAYLEITQGVTVVRKLLGWTIFIVTAGSYFS